MVAYVSAKHSWEYLFSLVQTQFPYQTFSNRWQYCPFLYYKQRKYFRNIFSELAILHYFFFFFLINVWQWKKVSLFSYFGYFHFLWTNLTTTKRHCSIILPWKIYPPLKIDQDVHLGWETQLPNLNFQEQH